MQPVDIAPEAVLAPCWALLRQLHAGIADPDLVCGGADQFVSRLARFRNGYLAFLWSTVDGLDQAGHGLCPADCAGGFLLSAFLSPWVISKKSSEFKEKAWRTQ